MFSSILELLVFTAALSERDWLIDVVMRDRTAKLLPLFPKCFAEEPSTVQLTSAPCGEYPDSRQGREAEPSDSCREEGGEETQRASLRNQLEMRNSSTHD
ncbi:hypothetical protein MHYP_G00170850 [Metynnis hypsauchen]